MTPDNGGFATAAYILVAIVYGAYVLSLTLRERRLRERLSRVDAPARTTPNRPAGA
ncbi:MAG TPA: hypothetical protein VKA54_07400 [Gemmatimonadaceae bacterium]|nr:hypothetical protein [Gemmatimonadaceae bacterium]